MSLTKKLMSLVAVALIALVVVALAGVWGLNKGQNSLADVAKVRMSSVVNLEKISEGATAIRSENRMIGLLLVQGAEPELFGKVLEKKKEIWQRIQKSWVAYQALPKVTEEGVLWKRFEADWAAWKSAEVEINKQIERLSKVHEVDEIARAKADWLVAAYAAIPFFNKSEATLGELVELNIRLSDEMAKEAERDGERSMLVMTMATLIAIGILLMVGGAIGKGVVDTIGGEPDMAKAVVERIAAGDLTQSLAVKTGDNTSLIANQSRMQNNLRQTIKGIAVSVSDTEFAADSLASAAQQVAAASADSSESASSMSAAVEELSASISQITENAKSALILSEQAGKLSSEGGGVIEQAIEEINRIAHTVRETSSGMSSLSASSGKISTIVQVIKDVADQTNLLALNAAIEAARAGEQGRGFAVVADEVRKLAERTTSATVEISEMITKIQTDANMSLKTMEGAVEQVDKGVYLASQAGTAIAEIRNSVTQVVGQVNDMVSSIQEQSMASQQIAHRVERVAQSSEANNAAAQQTSASADRLRELARTLKSSIGQFKTS
ncbi:MAG: hypothetical protein RIR18_1953 [Pseudomonadota bacterium]|jgi:methyl-accepting chemotaxis protein